MQIKGVRPESFTKQIRCDRCGRLFEDGEVEFNEIVSIDQKAGYGSAFGDGNDVQIDLCQHCLKRTLGRWLRVVEPGQNTRAVERFLHRLDPDRHGGEFPAAADGSFAKPEDMPVQECKTFDVEHPAAKRQLGLFAGPFEVPDDVDAPRPPQAMWALEQADAVAQSVLSEIEVRNSQGICTVADRAEYSAIKSLCGSIKEELTFAAHFNKVLTRRLILTKERLTASPVNANVEQLANEIFESEDEAWGWLNTPHPMLDGKTPMQAAETSSGAEYVKEILVAIKYGAAA